MPNHFRIGDRVRVPARLRDKPMPERIASMADGRTETVTQVEPSEWGQSGQLVSVDLFAPSLDAGWFEMAE